MAGKSSDSDERDRKVVAQEAARIIVQQGIRDYRVAKLKAAERLGKSTHGALPGNTEIERAVSEHLLLFGGAAHTARLFDLRRAALAVMQELQPFSPRLVGPVLAGTADNNSAIGLHLFSDSVEDIAMFLADRDIACQLRERRLKNRRGQNVTPDVYACYEFKFAGEAIEAVVFPLDGIRQAPLSPIDRNPMRRADEKAVTALLERL